MKPDVKKFYANTFSDFDHHMIFSSLEECETYRIIPINHKFEPADEGDFIVGWQVEGWFVDPEELPPYESS